jgi:hypothetical protein
MKTNFKKHYPAARHNERIERTIPKGLILKKADEETLRDITVYDLLAWYAGLVHVRGDIYENKSGEEFIRTQYGFRPVAQFNLNVRQEEGDRFIQELEYQLKVARKTIREQEQQIKQLKDANNGMQASQKDLRKLYREEVGRLRTTIETLQQQLPASKNKPESNRTEEKTENEKSFVSELDWSAYNDIVNDSERRIAS